MFPESLSTRQPFLQVNELSGTIISHRSTNEPPNGCFFYAYLLLDIFEAETLVPERNDEALDVPREVQQKSC